MVSGKPVRPVWPRRLPRNPARLLGATALVTMVMGATLSASAAAHAPIPASFGLTQGNESNIATIDGSVRPTTLKYTGDRGGDYHDPTTLRAKLTDANTGAPVAGQQISLKLGVQPACVVRTGADGTGQCTVVPTEPAGAVPIVAMFQGSAALGSSSDRVDFTVNREETTLVLLTNNANTIVANGTPVTLSAQLLEDGTTPIPSSAMDFIGVQFTLGSGASAQNCAGSTDIRGIATCTIPSVNQPVTADKQVDVTAVFPANNLADHYYQIARAASSLPLELHGGRAFTFSASINLPSLVREVAPTPDTGQIVQANPSSVTPPCVIHTGALASIYADGLCATITTSLAPGTSTVTSTIEHIAIAIPELPVITATTVKATSTTTCTTAAGVTTITGLTIGGRAVNPNIAPNTAIPVGQSANLIVNEQIPLANGLTVNALHLIGNDGTVDVIVASSTSDAQNCDIPTAAPRTSVGPGQPR